MSHYVIMYAGMEYNDEIYRIGGDDAKVQKTGYTNLDDAREAVRLAYKDLMKPSISTSSYSAGRDWSYRIGDFSYGEEYAAADFMDQVAGNITILLMRLYGPLLDGLLMRQKSGARNGSHFFQSFMRL